IQKRVGTFGVVTVRLDIRLGDPGQCGRHQTVHDGPEALADTLGYLLAVHRIHHGLAHGHITEHRVPRLKVRHVDGHHHVASTVCRKHRHARIRLHSRTVDCLYGNPVEFPRPDLRHGGVLITNDLERNAIDFGLSKEEVVEGNDLDL